MHNGTTKLTLEMRSILANARAKKCFLYAPYQSRWFAPDQLEKHWKSGRFIPFVEGIEICDPYVQLAELEKKRNEIESQIDGFKKTIEKYL